MQSVKLKTIFKYVAPSVIASVCFFLFTIIDGIFVGNGVGENALGAVNIVFPFIMIINAVFLLITVGGVAVAAVRFGKGNENGANDAFMHALCVMLAAAVLLTGTGTTLTKPIGYMLGANETYIGYVRDYLFWYSLFLIPSAIVTTFQYFCRNDGSPVLVMVATAISSASNIFLDWLFVYPLKKGMAGAAIATGISQTLYMFVIGTHFMRKKGKLRIRKFAFSKTVLGKIFLRGVPESVSQFAVPVSTICLNYVLLDRIGEIAVNAFSVINYVASFSVAIFVGVAQGIQPLLGKAYGEKNEKDLFYIRRVSAVIDVVGAGAIYVLLLFVGSAICGTFGANTETSEYVNRVMPAFAWGFIVMSLNTLISTYLYSTKRTKEAIIMNALRSFVFTIAVILLLPLVFGNGIIWHTFGIYEALSLIVGFILMKRSERNGITFK